MALDFFAQKGLTTMVKKTIIQKNNQCKMHKGYLWHVDIMKKRGKVMKQSSKRNLTMVMDLYELTMANGYFNDGDKTARVAFDVFYRKNPDRGGFAIFAGLEQIVEYIEDLHFSEEDVEYLRSLNTFTEDFLQYLKEFKFAGDVYAFPEGTIMYPNEPVLTVVAPLIDAQIVETAILAQVNHQSLVATKTARIVKAAEGKAVSDFGARRAHNMDAAVYGARASYIGGAAGTATVLAGQMFGIPVSGTMAHSWVMYYKDEYEAFKHYAENYPDNTVLLVDTYDTLKSGVPNAIRVFQEMKEAGIPLTKYGIRLDSGDLAYLSKKARKMLDEAGFPDAIISASNDLDEFLIDSLKVQGAAITSWGVGTHLITSKDCPSFGGVYKLAAVMGKDGNFIPKIKLSENTEKVTNPGNKKIYRIYEKESGKIKADLICLADEVFDENEPMLLFDPLEPWKKTKLPAGSYTLRELMVPVFLNGECVYESPKVMDIQAYCKKELETLWPETRRLVNPHKVYVDLSAKLYDIKISLLDQMSAE